MPSSRRCMSAIGVLASALALACGDDASAGAAGSDGAVAGASGESPPDAGSGDSAPAGEPMLNSDGVRLCSFVPGESGPVEIPAELLAEEEPPSPPEPPIEASAVPAATTERQLATLSGLRSAVFDLYVDPNFRGKDWEAITARYETMVAAGFTDEDFARAMQAMLNELGDEHSYFQSAEKVAEDEAAIAQGQNYVGVGFLALPVGDYTTAAIIALWPDGPAAEAGLRVHDRLLEVDGGPVRDENGISRTRGPEGTEFELAYERPGEARKTVTLTRRAVTGPIPVDYCLFPGTRIGYVLVPTFLDESIDEQVSDALVHMASGRPLEGLVFDNRMNGGGLGSVAQATLALFVDGNHGRYVSRTGEDPLDITGRDLEGSQSVPLVVLVDRDTVSYGEIFSGVLQVAGRAQVVGGRSAGNVEQLRSVDFPDGSRAWLAAATFAPVGLGAGAWEGVGIEPDVSEPTRWDQFTEATDPAITRALELLP